MSQEINPSAPLIQRPPLPDLQQPNRDQPAAKQKPEVEEKRQLQPEELLRSTLKRLSGGREHEDDKSFKAFTKLSRSLEKTFGEAEKVEREDGERELKQGGLRRVDKDLRKLFKGLGMPPQLAKHFSRGISNAMGNEDVEQINFSMTSSRSFNLDVQQQQSGYLASGDGSMVAASVNNSFQLSTVQTQSLDISINLRTGEFSLNRSSSESLTISSSSTAALASFTPAAEQEVDENAEEVAAPQDDFAALVQQDSTLMQISRTVKQSAVMQLTPATNSEEADDADDELFNDGVSGLEQLVQRLEDLTEATKDAFESLVQIRNLRVERDEEDDDDHLRFTVDAQSPIGLTAVDDEGRGTTIYPRPDGSIGKIADEEVKVTA